MDPGDVLLQITIPNPCPKEWAQMRGDDRVRFCDSCHQPVYNLSSMKSTELVAFLEAQQGQEFCGQLYRRPDGTVVTMDCPQPQPQDQTPPRRFQFHLRAIMAGIAAIATLLGFGRPYIDAMQADLPSTPPVEDQPTQSSPPQPSEPGPAPFGGKVCLPPSTLP